MRNFLFSIYCSNLINSFYRNENIKFVSILPLDACDNLLFEKNNLNKKDYNFFIENNKEFNFSEIQNFSTPKWNFKYKIICNKDKFIKKLINKDNKIYIFSDTKFLNKFLNENKDRCDMIYSTVPSFMINLNFENWINRLSNWFVYKC